MVSIFTGHRRREASDGFGHEGPNDAHIEWLNSNPPPGEVLVDTGLASAADCQKLRPPVTADRGELEREIARMTTLVERTKELFESGDVDAEAQRVNNAVAQTLKKVGLDPERFGVSLPEG
jgi:hypothetical protein